MIIIVVLATLLHSAPSHADAFTKVQRAVATKQTETLTKLLGHTKSVVRQRAALGLQVCSTQAVAELSSVPLRNCLEDETERDFVRAACGQTLSVIGDEDAVSGIIAALEDARGDARFRLVQALTAYRTPEAKATLAQLSGDLDPFVAATAQGALK